MVPTTAAEAAISFKEHVHQHVFYFHVCVIPNVIEKK
jgi:hypothetical protein